jgi:hypothetical protein
MRRADERVAQPGSGSAYIYTARDSNGRYFGGGKTYKVTIPAPVPAALFWSFSIYENQHRSFLETDQKLAGIDSTFPAMKKNADGSATVWFRPNAPAGQESNWLQTVPGKRLVHHVPALRPATALVRHDLEAGRFRAGAVTATHPALRLQS